MERKVSIKKTVDELHCDCVSATPQDFDFGEGYGETWETVDPDLSEMDHEKIRDLARDAGMAVEDIPPDKDDADDADDWRKDIEERFLEHMRENEELTPMMNYLYPIDGCRMSAEDIQAKLIGTALVAVTVHGGTFMALAGGGMDFSWDICEAYIRLGMLPPVHFRPDADCRDPDAYKTRLIAAAYVKSCQVAAGWARRGVQDMRHTMDRLREHKARRIANEAKATREAKRTARKAG